MSDWIYAVILGVVEGLTEFIPVSSTAMLLLAQKALGLSGPFWHAFTVLIQLGAILAVVVLYFGRFWNVLLRLPSDPRARRFVLSIIVAFVPAGIAGFLFKDIITQVLFSSLQAICIVLIVGGVVLLVIDRIAPAPTRNDSMTLPIGTAFIIGLFQCLALMPGVSRSGATIVGSMLMGVEKHAAAEFSFFLAIPIMAGAFTLDLWKNRNNIHGDQAALIAFGFAVSFVVGYIVVRKMLDFVTRHGFAPFAWWRIAVGAIGLVALMATGH